MSIYPRASDQKRLIITIAIVAPILSIIIAAVIVASVLLKPASAYAVAKDFLDEGDYVSAYNAFVELGDYRDSAQMADNTAKLAYEATINGKMPVRTYINTFKLKPETYHLAYDLAVEQLNSLQHDSSTKAWLESKKLMDLLPEDYKDCAAYKKLFKYLDKNVIICETDIDFVKENWSIPYVQTIAFHQKESPYFLEGEWKTEDGTKFLSLQMKANGLFKSTYSIPFPKTSVPAVGFSLTDNIYTMYDADGNPLGTAFTFVAIDFDHVRVNCMADNSSYILTRQ